ncbi:hypothetical protein B0H13DRAFT_2301341 [Mycena leptocephala]|nr:hypothetical protein B0H13DRAFT_2301341 [Mycena leptocephala]
MRPGAAGVHGSKKSPQGGNVPKVIGITFTPFPHSPRLLLSLCLSCVHLSQPAEMHTRLPTLVLHLLPGTRSATSLKQTAQAFKLESAVARADAHPRIHARAAVTSVLVLPSDPTFFLSSARPGDIINATKQKRRSPDEKAADDLLKEQAKAAKEKTAVEAHQAGVQRVAQKDGALRAEDELARKNSARPDLVTVELEHVQKDISMDPVSDHDNSEDESYQPDEEEAVQEFLKKRALEKKKKAGKDLKAAIRTEINDAAGFTSNESNTLKRKPSAQTTEIEPKKSKTALGGLKKGWKKAIDVATKVPKATAPAPKTPAPVPRGRADNVSSMLSLRSVSRSTFTFDFPPQT